MKRTFTLTGLVILAIIGGIIVLTNTHVPAPTQNVEKTLDADEYIQ